MSILTRGAVDLYALFEWWLTFIFKNVKSSINAAFLDTFQHDKFLQESSYLVIFLY